MDPDTDLIMYECMEYVRTTTRNEKRSREESMSLESEVVKKAKGKAKAKPIDNKDNNDPGAAAPKAIKQQKPFTEKQIATLDKMVASYNKVKDELAEYQETIETGQLAQYMPQHIITKLASFAQSVDIEAVELDLVKTVGHGSMLELQNASKANTLASRAFFIRVDSAIEEAESAKDEAAAA